MMPPQHQGERKQYTRSIQTLISQYLETFILLSVTFERGTETRSLCSHSRFYQLTQYVRNDNMSGQCSALGTYL